jgi:DUF438 domain-containing protein
LFVSGESSRKDKTAILKDIILDLHGGLPVTDAKDRFEREIGDISSSEIAELEQGLIDEGLSVDEIKQFCNVHALLFQSALERAAQEETSPSHPVYLFRLENTEIQKRVDAIKRTSEGLDGSALATWKDEVRAQLVDLRGIDTHYERKEQVLFPHLEKVGFMGPSKVMWGKDNEIRDLMKAALAGLDTLGTQPDAEAYVKAALSPLLEEVEGMIFKEENILFPTSLEKLKPADWVEILKQSDEVGYVYIEKSAETEDLIRHLREALEEEAVHQDGAVSLPSGVLALTDLMPLLNTLPVDLTFVGADDTVKYFSEGKERIFARPRAIVGRKVQNCHPPQSVDVVEKILDSFKNGSRDSYEFWLEIGGKFIHIRYFAVRDGKKRYLGTLEVSQDVTHIRKLEGEKRLLDERD